MVLSRRNTDCEDSMPQLVPSAGFTPPCDYNNFADSFDLSLLPGGEQPLSPSVLLYAQSPPSIDQKKYQEPEIYTTFYGSDTDLEFRPDFQKLIETETSGKISFPQSPLSNNIYLEVPQNNYHPNSPNSTGSLSPFSQHLLSPNDQFTNYRVSAEANFYPSSPELSVYAPSPSSVYSKSPCEEYFQSHTGKIETTSNSPVPNFGSFKIKEEQILSSPSPGASPIYLSTSQDAIIFDNSTTSNNIKQEESTVDFSAVLCDYQSNSTLKSFLDQTFNESKNTKEVVDGPKDHQLLRQALKDTSFQKKYNIKTLDFGFLSPIKMEERESNQDLMNTCNDQIARENIEPVFNLVIEQMRKEASSTCSILGISQDPSLWSQSDVLSWVQWTSKQSNLPEPVSEEWNIKGTDLLNMPEEDFVAKSPQGGMTLYAQLEIWKAACSPSENSSMQWMPETTSSNASSGDISEDDEETSSPTEITKPSSSRSGSHIHLWQFLKELLESPQSHGTCIRWLDRPKGVFKIEDSVKVARLWGLRKNRPAMNYDKLSRSIRQYYKKGIMKKTERSQRLVYQFCHPYSS